MLIKLDRIYLGYEDSTVIKDINLTIQKGDFIHVSGDNGSGKSTLLKLLYMKLLPKNGNFFLNDQKITKISQHNISILRRKIGVILQNNFLIPYLTVFQNIDLVNQIHKLEILDSQKRMKEIIDWVGLKDICNNKVDDLSEGEKKKVVIARALVGKPDILIADEPTNYLDNKTKEKFYFLLNTLNSFGTTVILSEKNDLMKIKNEHKRFRILNKQLNEV
ncbi:MAG: hypothetical protein CMP25_00685 [Rickettsiales bacterium]|nr:hypothetical protein [Rickettsiales bacterium]